VYFFVAVRVEVIVEGCVDVEFFGFDLFLVVVVIGFFDS